MRTTLLLSAGLLLAGISPLRAKPLDITRDQEEEKSAELEQAEEEFQELQRKIERKEIPPIEFEFNKAVLKPQSKVALEMVADLMFRHTDLKLMVFGHTCDVGSDEYNLWLSQKRAQAVKSYLVQLGVMGEYIKAKGFGKRKPIAPNDCEENRKKNRRVEFIPTKRWWESVF
ncbi:MAG: hypothetical protein A2X36_14680 [Elusimicrobia bacterium GWA2_69_24]|nr:MAG: hypothetical protein A2X36_14680 [Elusimicrobia bacterium GWA2_69_24]HBL17640.1 hypothetical protein [Elusimicrobiota bacterium]